MKALYLFTIITVTTLHLCIAEKSAFVEECVSGKYPPTVKAKIPTYTINLDDAPHERWAQLAKEKGRQIQHLIDTFKSFIAGFSPKIAEYFLAFVDGPVQLLADTLPYPFADEIKGLSEYSGVPLGEVVLYNIFYELFSMCTSIIEESPTGKLYHARNLDFGLLMGWEPKKHSWMVTDALRPLIVQLDFQRQGKTVFKSVSFAGYVGILTAVKPQMFTMTMDERFALDGGYVGIIQWIMGKRTSKWMSFLTREVMENATSYAEAKAQLTKTAILSPAYFILGGNQSGQGCIITRARDTPLDVWDLGTRNSTWYLVETNYDNWKKPLFLDDRRTPAHKCLDHKTQKSAGFQGLYDVLSSRPMLNKLTTYTALMQVNAGTLETYLQYCPDPCAPW